MASRIVLIALLLASFAAFAAEQAPNMTSNMVAVKELCQKLTEYQPAEGVEYKPGQDVVNGKKVVPADLDGGSPQIQMNDTINLNIGTERPEQLNLPANVPYTAYLNIGQVTVKKDGSVYFNGKRISQAQAQYLCKDQAK
jgi:hypothetical protein